jgi:hypothetical protein
MRIACRIGLDHDSCEQVNAVSFKGHPCPERRRSSLARPRREQARDPGRGLLVLVAVLLALHVLTPTSRAVSYGVAAASLLVVWLGVKLTYG